MNLSKENITRLSSTAGIDLPGPNIFDLPEKVVQFGTGVLLRALVDFFIDKANKQGIFNGRVVMVKSTAQGDIVPWERQDNLYTTCIRGATGGQKIEEWTINASISRVLTAQDQWQDVLACARNPGIRLVISNTTEVGITLTEDNVTAQPPQSFPGKLLAFLLERYKTLGSSPEHGLVIIPTELIPGNAEKLCSILRSLADKNKLGDAFIQWMFSVNHFCNSLVDRIVPGRLNDRDRADAFRQLGYEDELLIMAEPFRLWAIESGQAFVKDTLSFSQVDDGVVIAPDIGKFRELKLRLLNGTHTYSCGLAFLAGFELVREGMANKEMASFIQTLATHEIADAMRDDTSITHDEAIQYAHSVFDRFRNPYIDHPWINITLHYSSKMKMRNLPLLVRHYQQSNLPPDYMALGFAAFILFMKCKRNEKGVFTGSVHLSEYIVQDDQAAYFAAKWEMENPVNVAASILADEVFWGVDLTSFNGFADQVQDHLHSLLHNGAMATLRALYLKKMIA